MRHLRSLSRIAGDTAAFRWRSPLPLTHTFPEFGAQVFRLDVLEELEQRPDQSQAEFLAGLHALEQRVSASLDPALAY